MSCSKEKYTDEATANTSSDATTSKNKGVHAEVGGGPSRISDLATDKGEQQQLSSTSGTTGSKISFGKPKYFPSFRPNVNRKTTKKYLADLIKEKDKLDTLPSTFNFRHANRLVTEEINKARQFLEQTSGSKLAEAKGNNEVKVPTTTASGVETNNSEISTTPTVLSTCGQKVLLQEKLFVPVNLYPKYNFVGRILGPRGLTAKQLEMEYGCRIMIRGRGSTRETSQQKKNSEGMEEELHVLIQCEDVEEVAKEKMKRAVAGIRLLLVPPPEGSDEFKRKQLMELSIINGTYRPTNSCRAFLSGPKILPSLNPGQAKVETPTCGTKNTSNSGNAITTNSGPSSTISFGAGINFSHNSIMHNACNVYTMNMRQALASLGFAMDAFGTTDCHGKRMNRDSLGCFGNQGAIVPASSNFSSSYGFNPNILDPSGMQYTWSAAMNSSTHNFLDNSPSALIREYWNQLMAGSRIPVSTSSGVTTTTSVTTASTSSAQPTDPSTSGLSGTSTFRSNGAGDGPSSHDRS